METQSVIFLIIGLGIGVLIGILVFKVKNNSHVLKDRELAVQLQLEQERSKKTREEQKKTADELRREREEVLRLNNEHSTLKANHKNLQTRLEEHKGELSQLQEKFAIEFKNLANEIFEEKTKKFTDQNKTNLHELLNPLGQKITEFEKKVEQTNKDSLVRGAALREQILGLRELNTRMTQETENLTKALKGDVKMQGNWGEVILERILEKSGLEKDREYVVQETLQSDDGKKWRPDVVIKLPDNKNFVIDSKMSLIAYDRYMNTEDEEEKKQHLNSHVLSVKAHVTGLAEKNYHQLVGGNSVDYVLMFIPIESAFTLIVQHGGELYNQALEKNIMIISPATLVPTLRTVSSIWKNEHQSRNAVEIARQGGALYDKFKSFVDDLAGVGKSIDKSKQQYGLAMNKLIEGQGNLVRRTEQLKKLGVNPSKSMDDSLLYRAGAKDDDEMAKLSD